MLKKLLQSARGHYRRGFAVLAVTVAISSVVGLMQRAAQENTARENPDALPFEAAPDRWLAHPTTLADFRKALEVGSLAAVAVDKAEPGLVLYTLKGGATASTLVPGCTVIGCAGTVLDSLGDRSARTGFALVRVDVDPRSPSRRWLDVLTSLLSPLIVVAALVGAVFLSIRLQSGMGGGASRLAVRPKTQFSDAIGQPEAKAALKRVKAFLKDPAHYAKLGAVAPRGVLLVGPPGTGKTLMAKALAGESKANFIAVDGSYFTATFYGAGVNKVKALFKLARQSAPCVLFIDEIDGIGKRSRSGDLGGAESELNRIINRVLVEMDGFSPLDNVVVVGATNHEDNIDEAMRRPGRFDMLVHLTLPTLTERQQLFDLYIGKLTHDGRTDSALLARMAAGMSPADIANTVNKAASTAAETQAAEVTTEHFLQALETHQLGGEVSAVKESFTPQLRDRLAYHEAGHALVGHWLNAGIVERVSIEPRGRALGVTYISRDSEDPLYQQSELSSRLAMMLAGREAELRVFDSVSTGASDDLKRASELAINMVGSLGFSATFGLLSVPGIPKELLGPDIQAAVLREARVLLERAQATSQRLLETHRQQLDALAQCLLEREVVSGEDLKALLGPRALSAVNAS